MSLDRWDLLEHLMIFDIHGLRFQTPVPNAIFLLWDERLSKTLKLGDLQQLVSLRLGGHVS